MDRLVASFGEKTSWSVRGRSLTLIGWGGPWGEVYRGFAPREPKARLGPIVRISACLLPGHAMWRSLAPIDVRIQPRGLACNPSHPKKNNPPGPKTEGVARIKNRYAESDQKLT